jgi:dephospho-CoA kinase
MELGMEVLTLRDACKKYGIALTGGIATGKSTIARLLRDLEELVIDADQLARDITAPGSEGLKTLCHTFGEQILTLDGTLDRKKMRQAVFADPNARATLESITHPLIQKALEAKLDQAFEHGGPRRFFYEAALIYEAGRDKDFAEVWSTYCGEDTQLKRLMARDNISLVEARETLKNQWPALEKAQRASYTINTEAPEDQLKSVLRRKLGLSPTMPSTKVDGDNTHD